MSGSDLGRGLGQMIVIMMIVAALVGGLVVFALMKIAAHVHLSVSWS